jgi:hypothetical protein
MKTTRKRGAVLTLVIMAMSLMALIMLVLSEGANTMLFHADAAYCRAVERNLTASALAWSQSQTARGDVLALGDPVALNCDALGDQRAALTVRFARTGDTAADVRIETSCHKGRQRLEALREYAISPP